MESVLLLVALLAVAFWGLIPHAFEEVDPAKFQVLSGTILAGILGFFCTRKTVNLAALPF